jgi:hypothetical protein
VAASEDDSDGESRGRAELKTGARLHVAVRIRLHQLVRQVYMMRLHTSPDLLTEISLTFQSHFTIVRRYSLQ